ncbi:MAG: hydrogenase maturation protease [Streptosporangiaceae bacterium]
MTAGSPRTLVAGVGNIFFSDDGFGSEVAKRLAECDVPEGVTVADYGISGMHLAHDLCDGYDRAILIDATPRGGAPGTVYVLQPEQPAEADSALFNAHGMQPDVVLGMLDMLGGKTGQTLIVGCEPAVSGPGIGLSPPVAAAVDDAVRKVLELIRET